MFSLRRVKNDQRDAADLADLLRMGRLPEAWIAPPATRELRGWVRHRAKLVGLRSNLKCQVHAVLAGAGVQVPMSDLFGAGGQDLLARVAAGAGVAGPGRLAAAADRAGWTSRSNCSPSWSPAGCARDRGYLAIQPIPGVGSGAGRGVRRRDRRHRPVPPGRAAGLVGRADPETPRVRHHRAPRPDHQTRLSAGALGRGRGRATRRARTPASGRSATGSGSGAAATSASSPPPAN